MDLTLSPRCLDLAARLEDFLERRVYPAERIYAEQRAAAGPGDHTLPPIVEELKAEAREIGLWNLFLPDLSGLDNLDYAHLAELTGRSPYIAPEALNCAAPDTGNMELLHLFGTAAQKERWLEPLLDGRIRSGFSMTEPRSPPPTRATSPRRSSATATTTSSTGASGGRPAPPTRAARCSW